MDYIRTEADGQLTLTQSTEFLILPSCLYGFTNTETTVKTAKSGRVVYCHKGTLDLPEEERICTCGRRMHINTHLDISIRHLCIGGNLSCLIFPHNQLRCPECGATKSQFISFKAAGHLITEQLHQYACDLLSIGIKNDSKISTPQMVAASSGNRKSRQGSLALMSLNSIMVAGMLRIS